MQSHFLRLSLAKINDIEISSLYKACLEVAPDSETVSMPVVRFPLRSKEVEEG